MAHHAITVISDYCFGLVKKGPKNPKQCSFLNHVAQTTIFSATLAMTRLHSQNKESN